MLGVPIYPKGVRWGWDQGSVQASQVLSTPISTNYFCMDLALCTGALLCWYRKVPSSNCCLKVGSTESSRMSLYAVALIFPFSGTKEPDPKTAPDHYSSSTKLYSWHYAFGQVVFSWNPPSSDLSVGLPDGEAWFITTENTFHLRHSPMAESFTPLQLTLDIAHGDLSVRLLGHGNQFHEGPDEQFLCWRCFQSQFGTQ